MKKRTKRVATAHPEAELIKRVRAQLSARRDVAEKRMFGATAFLVGGKLCVTARAERLMCRIDPAEHDEVVARSGVTAVKMGGRLFPGYVHVLAKTVRTERALKAWVDQAVRFNQAQRKNRTGKVI